MRKDKDNFVELFWVIAEIKVIWICFCVSVMTKTTIFLSMRLFVNAVIGSTKHLLWHAAVANQSKLANHHLELSENETNRDVIQSVSLHWAIFSFRFNEEVTIALFSPRLFVPEICPRNTGWNLISTSSGLRAVIFN